MLSDALAGVSATAEVTAASVENLDFLEQGSADLAFTLADTASDAVRGQGRFDRPLRVQALASLYRNATHVGVRAEGPLRAVADLRGRRVSTGAPNSGTEVIAERVLQAAGLDAARDLARERLGASESAAALEDGRIDAFFFSGGVPTAAVLELAATPGFALRLLSDAAHVPALVARHGPLYATMTIPAGTYPGVAAVEVSSVLNLLVCRAELDEELAYRITRALFAHRDELATAHPAARELDARVAASGSPIPYHPGALRYYRELGEPDPSPARR